MRKLIAVVGLAVCGVAWGQGLNPSPPGVATSTAKVLASFPLSTSGTMPENSYTVLHAYWDASGNFVDTKDTAPTRWTKNGTITTSAAFWGTAASRGNASAFGASNYYSTSASALAVGNSNFSVCAVVYLATGAGGGAIVGKVSAFTAGNGEYSFQIYNSAGSYELAVLDGSGNISEYVIPAPLGTVNVICSSYEYVGSGTSVMRAVVNLSAIAAKTNAVGPISSSSADTAVGKLAGVNNPYPGTIYEVQVWKGIAFSDAQMVEIQQRVLGHIESGSYGPISVTRASTASYFGSDGTVWTVPGSATAGAAVAPITSKGVEVSSSRSQYVLNSGTHPKTSQATATLSTGDHVAWHTGTGTMTLVDGTATSNIASSCSTVAAGTLCAFNVSSGGTMTITTTTGTVHAQIENGTDRTAPIVSAASLVTRNASQVNVTVPTLPANWCIAATVERTGTQAWGGTNRAWSLGTSGANTASLDLASTFTVTDKDAGTKAVATASTPSAARHRIIACDKGGTMKLSLDGTIASTSSGTGTGILTTPPTTLYLGGASASLYGNVFIKDIKICQATGPTACK